MSLPDLIVAVLLVVGCCLFLAGTLGLLRLPDVYTRLHALTKADNLGLGFVALGLIVQAGSLFVVVKILLIWGLVLLSSTTCCHLVARWALEAGIAVWRPSDDA